MKKSLTNNDGKYFEQIIAPIYQILGGCHNVQQIPLDP